MTEKPGWVETFTVRMAKPPGPESDFIELECPNGHSLGEKAGWWMQDDGDWLLVIETYAICARCAKAGTR